MNSRLAITLLLFTVLAAPVYAQQPEKGDERIVVTTNLVQVDAVVTDKNGKQVSDLKG